MDHDEIPYSCDVDKRRRQTFLLAAWQRVEASVSERCSAEIAEWVIRPGSRSAAIDSLRVELAELADEALTWRTGDYVRRLAAATGTATAVACTVEDVPWEVDWMRALHVNERIAARLEDDALRLKVSSADDEGRSAFRLAMLGQLLCSGKKLTYGVPTDELIWCLRVGFSLWISDLDREEFAAAA